MAVTAVPQNFFVQQGNGTVYLSWDISVGATGYSINRSTDGVHYSVLDSTVANSIYDSTVSIGTLYYYSVASSSSAGLSAACAPQSAVPTLQGQMSLGELRLRAQQRADRVNSNFIKTPEWNYYINQSAYELYDLLITVYEDYYVAPRLSLTTSGNGTLYPLPNGLNYSAAPALYKLYGVDCGLDASANAFATLKKFNFIERNKYVFPQITSNLLGVFNLQYRLIGSNLDLIPTPAAGQTIGIWYFPRLDVLLADSDILDGISGWTEYVIVDAAIKALRKEESDTQELMNEKAMLRQRIIDSATNRDAGQSDTISSTRNWGDRGGGANGDGWSGPCGGY